MSSIQVTSFKAQALLTCLEPATNGPGRVMPTHHVKPLRTPHLIAHAPPEEETGAFLLVSSYALNCFLNCSHMDPTSDLTFLHPPPHLPAPD